MEAVAQARSIHWRRRGWYVLWACLLLGALGFWAWWETPAVSGVGHVVLTLRAADLPPGSKVEVWTGPAKSWSPGRSTFQGPWMVTDSAKPLPVPSIELKAGLRRWHQGYIPRLTSDLLILRLDLPGAPPRYAAYDLSQDLNFGLAGPHRRLFISSPIAWKKFSEDASHPSPLLP